MNPKDGNYKLQIVPISTRTNFIIAQFLPNGQTLYKEYKLKGLIQETKVIEYNSKHPKDNPLQSRTEWRFWEFWKNLIKHDKSTPEVE